MYFLPTWVHKKLRLPSKPKILSNKISTQDLLCFF